MILWRISKHRDLSGRGGVILPGRWHLAGSPVVYLAESPAGALLEACVHTSANDIPPSFTLLKVDGLGLTWEEVVPESLPADWMQRLEISQELGTNWLRSVRSALLRVPSALIPETANLLLNPTHRDAPRFHIEREYLYPFDLRLKN